MLGEYGKITKYDSKFYGFPNDQHLRQVEVKDQESQDHD